MFCFIEWNAYNHVDVCPRHAELPIINRRSTEKRKTSKEEILTLIFMLQSAVIFYSRLLVLGPQTMLPRVRVVFAFNE